jgi:hypothetical protein
VFLLFYRSDSFCPVWLVRRLRPVVPCIRALSPSVRGEGERHQRTRRSVDVSVLRTKVQTRATVRAAALSELIMKANLTTELVLSAGLRRSHNGCTTVNQSCSRPPEQHQKGGGRLRRPQRNFTALYRTVERSFSIASSCRSHKVASPPRGRAGTAGPEVRRSEFPLSPAAPARRLRSWLGRSPL